MGVVGFGYEGLSIEEFVAQVVARGHRHRRGCSTQRLVAKAWLLEERAPRGPSRARCRVPPFARSGQPQGQPRWILCAGVAGG